MIATNARKSDPISSHAAGMKAEIEGLASSQRVGVLKRLMQSPNMTSKQLGQKYADEGYDRYVFARRLPELEKAGKVAVIGFAEGKQMVWGVV